MHCKCCSTEKSAEYFYSSNKTRCKECVKSAVSKYRAENIDRVRQYDRIRGSMPHRVDARKEYQKTSAFAESHDAAVKRWAAKHPERKKATIAVNNAVRDGRLKKTAMLGLWRQGRSTPPRLQQAARCSLALQSTPQRSSRERRLKPTLQPTRSRPSGWPFFMTTELKLYQLSAQYQQLAQQLADLDMDAQTVADTIEASGLVDDFTTKAQALEMVCREMTKNIPAIEAELKRLKALKEHRERIAAGLHDYLKFHMESTGIQKIEAPLFSISLRTNPPSVQLFDEAQVPEEFLVPKYSISKTAIKDAIKAGREVPGARMTQTTSLSIK